MEGCYWRGRVPRGSACVNEGGGRVLQYQNALGKGYSKGGTPKGADTLRASSARRRCNQWAGGAPSGPAACPPQLAAGPQLPKKTVDYGGSREGRGLPYRREDPFTGSDAALRRSVTFTLAGLPWKAVAMKVMSPVRCSVRGQAVGMGTCPVRWALRAARGGRRSGRHSGSARQPVPRVPKQSSG